MKDADLKRNASGYYDETCYKGITAPPRPGEIWTNKDITKCWLVLQTRDNVCSTLLLGKEAKENSIQVMARVPMYTDPVMIGYTFTDMMTAFVKKVPEDNFRAVKEAVAKAMGLTHTATEADRKKLEEENEGLKESYKTVFHENERLKADLTARNMAFDLLDASCREMTADLDRANIYKEMYLVLLDKLIAAKGGIAHE